jgi:outer membrane protein
MRTVILLLLLATHVRIAAGQAMPESTNRQPWTMEKCLAYTATHNHDLLAKDQSLQAATQSSKAAASSLAPSFTVKAEINHYWKIPVQIFPGQLLNQPAGTFIPVRMGTPWMGNYGVDADLPLVDVQTWQQIKLARLQQQAEKNEYNSLLQTLLKNTRIAYYSVQQQQAYVAVTAKLYGNYQHIHQLIALQFEKGLTDKIALNQSATLLKNREIDVIKAATDLQQGYLDLKFWMGYPLADSLPLAASGELPPLAVTGFNNAFLPGYEAAQSKVILAKQQYQTTRAALYPSLHLKGTWEQLGFGEKSDFITRSPWFSVGFVGIQLSMPLSLSRIAYKPREEKARWQAAEQQFNSYTAEQEKRYQQEKAALEQAAQHIRLQEDNIRMSEENEMLTMRKIDKGIIDMIQLKEVQKDLYEAQEKLNEARMDFFRHYTEINYLQNK